MRRAAASTALAAAALLAAVSGAWATDFGALVGLTPSYGDDGFEFSAGLTPWMSAAIGDESELYLSASLSLALSGGEWDLGFAPERAELVLRPVPGTAIRAGRFRHADHAGLAISGYYDGFSAQTILGGVNLEFSSLYGGLQDKDSSKILLSGADVADLGDGSVIFAPRRLVMSVGASVPGTVTYFVDALAQFDARGSDALHSQYLVLGAGGPLSTALSFSAALAGAVAEEAGLDPAFSIAASAGLGWMPVGGLRDRAYLDLRWATGDNGALSPYLSINAIPQGKIFSPRLAGLTVVRAGYTARFIDTLSAELQSTAFVRSLEGGPGDSGIDPGSDSAWLGAEVYASLRWAPLSDINLSSGLGLFVPGTAFLADEPLRWLVSVAMVLSL